MNDAMGDTFRTESDAKDAAKNSFYIMQETGIPLSATFNSLWVRPDQKNLDIWIENFDEGLKKAKEINKPIFVDFTGYTCTNCRWMETNVFEEPPVQELFKNFVLLKCFGIDKRLCYF